MKKKALLIGWLCSLLTFISFHANAQDLAKARKQIKKINETYSALFTAKDPKITALYCDDAALIPPATLPVRGKAALTKDFQTAFADVHVKTVHFATTAVYGTEQLVAEEGKWEVIGVDGKVIDQGNYLKLWKNTGDGLRIFRDIFNSDGKR